jgi:hypothetical protein
MSINLSDTEHIGYEFLLTVEEYLILKISFANWNPKDLYTRNQWTAKQDVEQKCKARKKLSQLAQCNEASLSLRQSIGIQPRPGNFVTKMRAIVST